MNTNGTQTIAVLIQLLFLIASFSVNAQPKYDFRNSTKISGTDRQVGALYRFPNVKSGVDALVTITAMTGGVILNTFDGTSSGFAEAFQPVITLPARSKGYVEFNIVFVTAGTSTPLVQAEIPVTPIDVDGQTGEVYEYDELYRSASTYVDYNLLGNELKITYPSASWIVGTNTAGANYGGVDTMAKQVMFSVVNAGVNSITVRTGADNISNQSQQRLRSLYFKRFTYPNSVLAQSEPRVLNQRESNNNIERTQDLKIFPTVIHNSTTLDFRAEKNGIAMCRLIDYTGRMVKQQQMIVQKGDNNILLNNLNNINSGNYIVLVNFDNTIFNGKIIKQ